MTSRRIAIAVALATTLAVGAWFVLRDVSGSRPNTILIVIDTLRADHVGTYGYERDTTPVIDSFAHENVRFDWAFSTAPWTSPSVASMFTGFYPTAHGVLGHTFPDKAHLGEVKAAVLNEDFETLAEALNNNGYRTAGVTANAWVADYLGFAQGFDSFKTLDYQSAAVINGIAFELLDSLMESEEPFFLYVHYMDPHFPYEPPPGLAERFKGPLRSRAYPQAQLEYISLYDGEIRHLDSKIGELLQGLRDRQLYDDSVILLVSDHGEQFGEDGAMGHGRRVFNYETHVPLILRAAGHQAEIDATVSVADIYPTLLDLARTKLPYPVQGVSMMAKDLDDREGVLIEATLPVNHKAYVRKDQKKLILAFEGGLRDIVDETDEKRVVGLHDIREDYLEEHSLDDRALFRSMRRAFSSIYRVSVERRYDPEDTKLTDETIEQLKALGYLD